MLLSLGSCLTATAGDWPGILGPHRNGVADGETLADRWPEAGPKLLWSRPVGDGLAGVAAVSSGGPGDDGICVLYHRAGDQEIVEGLRPSDGEVLWQAKFPSSFVPSINPDDGPRATPLIAGRDLFVFSPQGQLRCLGLVDGKVRWTRDTHQDYKAREGYFGVGSTPLVVGRAVIVNVGGRAERSSIVAFDRETGKTLWQAFDDDASYSSPIVTEVAGKPTVVVVTRLNVVGVDPASGRVRFQLPFGARGPTVNGANPVAMGADKLFLTASYGIGAELIQMSADSAEVLWKNDDVLSSQYTTPVPYRNSLIGIHGRQDYPGAELRCLDPLKPTVLWSEPDFGYATLILADDKLVIQKTDGDLVLAEAATTRFKLLSRTQLFRGTTRALPALSNGRYFARNESELKCVDLGR